MTAILRPDAAALIPEDTAKTIIKDMPKQSVVLQKFRTVKMSRKQQRLPVLSTLATAYFTDGDTGMRRPTKLQWANKYLNAEELSVIVPIPKHVAADTEFDLWGECRQPIIEAAGVAFDEAVLFGVNKPASWPDAIVTGAQSAGNYFVRGSIGGQDVAGDISDTMSLIESDGFMVNGHVASPTFKGSLRNLRATDKQPIFQQSLTAGTPGYLYNEPIIYSDNGSIDNDAAQVIMGDWSQGIVGIRDDINWDIWTEASIHDPSTGELLYALAQQNMAALVLWFRIAFQIANPVTRMNPTNSTRYPFAVLRPTGWTP